MTNLSTPRASSAIIAIAFATLAVLQPANAAAQEVADEPATQDDAVADAEIVVTAQKREGDIQKVPASITALGGDQLAIRGITDMNSLGQQVPNVNFAELTGTSFTTIRGVGVSVDSGIGEPSVASYVDGIYLPRATMAKVQLIDLERIEVLRGPQGTLYGRNSTAGAINFITAKPSDILTAGLNVGIGNYDQWSIGAFVSGPLAPGVLVRVSGSREKRDGFVKDLFRNESYGDKDAYSLRGAVRFEADDLTVDLSAQYQSNGNSDSAQGIVYTGAFPPGTLTTTEPYRVFSDFPSSGRNKLLVLGGTADWKFADDFTLRSTTGYVDHKSETNFDGDATNLGRITLQDFQRPSRSFSQEVDLIGEAGPLKFLVGLYYFREKFRADVPVVLPIGLGAIPPGAAIYRSLSQTVESRAIFIDGSLSLSDRFRINFGARYNDEESDVLQTSGVRQADGTFAGAANVPEQTSSKDFLPKIGAEFDVAPGTLVYVQFQKGVKSGGPNLGLFNQPFLPEQVKSYEIGLKARLAPRVTLNAAAYHYQYRDLQVTNLPAGATTALVVNADARVNGFEMELNAAPSRYFDFNFAATLNDAEYTDFIGIDAARAALGPLDLRGNKLTRTAPYTLSGGANLRVPVEAGPFSEIVLRGEAFFSGRYYLRPFNQPMEEQDAYALLNASLTLQSDDSKYRLRFFVENITDEPVLQAAQFSTISGGLTGAYGPPRTYGVTLSLRY